MSKSATISFVDWRWGKRLKMRKSKMDVESLLEQIEIMREELVNIGLRDGLTASSTLEYSQLLDERIKVYQKLLQDT